ncbi:hypothetical protein [Aurantiacibacter spongiae]|uniref:Uncharacterized protein n=1 Tax=Aurantiacibacter spongiae TaxID=2488860 RepID=A0A3N5CTA6_9SPHN|nr:hypothetical protein [Aurantiacibacter spongiae]RPF70600.1 hypothetical protein EG799_02390 [Aurantiacibacter spongiae]
MLDSEFLILAFVVNVLVTFVSAFAATRNRQEWSARRVILVASLPGPMLLATAAIILFIRVQWLEFANPEACGFDMCGFAIVGVVMGLLAAVICFIVNLLPALLGGRLAK